MRSLLLLALFLCSIAVYGQAPYILPGTMTDDIADRWDILYGTEDSYFASQRNTARDAITERAYQLLLNENLSTLDRSDVRYIIADNNEYQASDFGLSYTSSEHIKIYDSTSVFYSIESLDGDNPLQISTARQPILKYFYKSDANFFEVDTDNFSLRANPILHLSFGNGVDDPNTIFQNTRGAEIRGRIDDKIYFYTNIHENQRRFNNYIERRIENLKAIPGNGLYKSFQSTVVDQINGYDYLNSQAYAGINATESVAIEFGHGKHFIGNGVRSLLTSDYGQNYFYLKFNTRIWKFNYQNLFAELSPVSARQNPGDRLLPKKYMAQHYLSFKPTKNIELGIFEAIVFSRENTFEFQYLNPIILYRTVEQFLDSPDNALVGLNGKWNIKNRFQIYGQLILDEFKLDELRSGNGWWANKYGIQLGAKYINVAGIDHLDLQVEYNVVRPYTYAHRDSLMSFSDISTASFSHYNQPLAHPLGANFTELLVDIRYQPIQRLFIRSRIISGMYGQDIDGSNFGGNILIKTGLREFDFGNEIGQGVNTTLMSLSLDVSYQFAHNYFIDINALYRNADAALDDLDIVTQYVGFGLRANIGRANLDY